MKHFFSLFIILFFAQFTFVQAQTFHDTQGKFEVSQSGQATFTLPITLPIALPPSIEDVGPTINLVYASGQMGGIAGQGWNISAISNISRIATRKDIDGFVDGVDFDDNDKLALDGQRLLIKTGTYWTDGSTYETEVQSNTRVKLIVIAGIITFEVTAPDGSKSLYGGASSSDLTAYYINRFEDTKGNFIVYSYNKPLNKSLCINEISFSANTNSNTTPLNKIKFNYVTAARTENAYVAGVKIEKVELLNNIQVFTNTQKFKRYLFFHTPDELGYQRITKIQELNGEDLNATGANSIDFEYYDSSYSQTRVETPQDDTTLSNMENPKFSGDFTGEGDVDFIKGNLIYKNQLGAAPSSATLPFTADNKTFAVNTNIKSLTNSIIKLETTANSFIIKNYDLSGGTTILNNTKTIPITYTNIPIEERNYCSGQLLFTNSNILFGPNDYSHLTGDFNGDGISELLSYRNGSSIATLTERKLEYIPQYDDNGVVIETIETCTTTTLESLNYSTDFKLVDLNPNVTNIQNSATNTSFISEFKINPYNKFVLDFNGDGKDDILTIDEIDGYYNIISFKTLSQSPCTEVESLGQGVFTGYNRYNKPLIFGDFNGDGKIDITIPVADGSYDWRIFYGNPKLSGTSAFFDETYETTPILFTPYAQGGDGPRWRDWHQYVGMDINKDGKTDIVRVKTSVYYRDDFFFEEYYSFYQYTSFVKTSSSFTDFGTSIEHELKTSNRFDLIAVNTPYKSVNQDLILQVKRRPGYMNSQNINRLDFIKFNKNISNENHLKKVTQSNGAIVDEIFYKPMDASNVDYTPDNTAIYPNVNVNRIPTLNLVDYVKNTSLGTEKYMKFKYAGYTVNYNGLGNIGFQKTARSNWHKTDTDKIIWSVAENDILKRGALLRTYSKMRNRTAVFSFTDNTNLLSKTENDYNVPPNSFPYILTLKTQTNTDYLTDVKTEKLFKYSTDGFYLPIETTTTNYLGTVPQGSSCTKTEFCPNNFGTGSSYYIGRPDNTITVTTAYGDTKSSYSKLSYTGSNVTQIEKKVGTTEASLATATEKIIETMTYAPNGNLLSKTILPTGFPVTTPPIAARATSFTYDATNRFVKTSTDVEGLITTNNTYHPLYGTVTSQTNPFGQTTLSTYDTWGKPTSITDFLGKSITYSYLRTDNLFETKQVGSDGSITGNYSDALGRVSHKYAIDFNNIFNFKHTLYNWKGQITQSSEPYVNGAPPALYSISEYDDYGRTTKTIAHTGQITTYTYNGLITTVYDGKVTKTTVKNANGHIVSTSEVADGETANTITYTYDGNGNLLTSSYGAAGMTMVYDLWGRKTSLNDISAGATTYTYNGYGEMLTELNPRNVLTTLTYNAVGKPLTKLEYSQVSSLATDIATTYVYDSTRKWLKSMSVVDPYGGNSTFIYSYDTTGDKPTFQLNKTIEDQITLGAKFTKTLTFDDFGRPATETNKAEMGGKTSTKTTFNVYVNGVLKEIKDTNATGASIWKTETVNARGQLTKGVFGNGIEDLSTYDDYGYYTQKNFKKLNTDLLKIDYAFGSLRGNLGARTDTLLDTYEEFSYDSNDRLKLWSQEIQQFQNCKFNNSIEGFTLTGPGIIRVDNAKLALNQTTSNTIVEKKIITNINANNGKYIKIKFDYTTFNSSCNVAAGVPYGCNNANLWVAVYSKNTLTQAIEVLSNLPLTAHTIIAQEMQSSYCDWPFLQGNVDIYIKFYTTLINPTYQSNLNYTIDNLVVINVEEKNQDYDNRGRITANELGDYGYPASGKIYQNNKVKLLPEAQPYYITDRTTQNITYNAYKCPIEITEAGKERISFSYNAMHDRSVMYYGSAVTNKMARPFRKFYSADGSMEIKYTLATNSYEFVTYLGGDAYSAPAVVKSDGTTQNTFYLHRDNQSSILAVSNSVGTVIERRFFDAWGQLARFEKNGLEVAISSLNATNGIFLDRGYTGHEHLLGVGLINMNARLYDPKLRRFLQTDNEVQDPTNAQNYNRYGYCLNNPLKYTDFSGNHPILIAVLVSAILYVGKALIFNEHINAMGLITSSLTTGFTAVATFGIGTMVNTIGNFAVKTTVQTLAHGVFNGGMAAITGGDFWQGFAAGAVASLASSLYTGGQNTAIGADGQRYGIAGTGYEGFGGSSGLGQIAFGTIMGGVGASLTGGNFWQGAVTGLIVSGLNHSLHSNKTKMTTKSKDGITPTGEIEFKGLTKDQLSEFRIIPEDFDPVTDPLITPTENNKTYEGDGFYQKGPTDEKYWYKVSGGSKVTVSFSGGKYNYLSYVNEFWSGVAQARDKYYRVDWQPKSLPHWTINPFDLKK